ncbi:hypothetical protein ACM46_10235 [Chryseobacterium angstadtii]|uniref:Endonuclease/exonuclease/phosphatase domain-containing protein n=2 Tax=Chryseobacterium angstadtii TaxID=558151 RepID=A0A0J7IF28_9FLAO|nr:hypothetical protein ACM46_10235 [Chryseobacterium angstadtii]
MPDILVIIEATTGTDGLPEGETVDESSSYYLMQEIRQRTGNNNWYLVPPLVSGTEGRAEGIAVLYNSANLIFTGPWRWPGGDGPAGSVAAIPNANMRSYNAPYMWRQNPYNPAGPANPPNPNDPDNTLPNRNIPLDSANNPGRLEYQVAGQWDYHTGGNPANAQLNFPDAGKRRPFLTTFYDTSVAVNGSTHREIRLLSFHASPYQFQSNPITGLREAGPAATGTAEIANIFEMNQALAPNQVNVIVGDFNIPLWNYGGVALPTIAYNPIIALGYQQQLQQVPNNFPDKAYRITHIKPSDNSTPYNDNGFPAFGYMTEPELLGRYDAIDNIFVRYPPMPNNAGGPAANMTIVNRVTGSPYTGAGLPALPVGVPAGTGGVLVYPQYLTNAYCMPVPNGVAAPNIGLKNRFQGWNNYRRIRSTSDHLALIVDI